MEKFSIPLPQERCYLNLQYFLEKQVVAYGSEFVHNEEQADCLQAMATWLTEKRGRWGLLLAGIAGNGKTVSLMAMRTFVNLCKLPDPIPSLSTWSLNAGIWIINARELSRIFVSGNGTYERCKSTYILAIDDLGVEDSVVYLQGNRYKPMEDILYYRYERMLTTIVTTNLPLPTLREKYGDRLGDRFNEMFKIIPMPNINFRERV